MITFISFIIIMVGIANWLCIGLMQYDFIAGFFGTQSSLLSRLIYIIIGFAGIWFLFMAIRQKGKIKLNSNGFEKDVLAMEKSRPNKEKRNEPKIAEDTEVAREIHEHNSSDHRNPFE